MKALFVGLGGIGQRHLRNLRTLLGTNVEVIAYRARRLSHVITPALGIDRAADVESLYGVTAFTDLDEALAQRPDVAFVTNPSSLHVETALACARAGCDLFIEKPLAASTGGIDDLIALVNERGLVAMVGYQLRFHPALERFAAIMRDGSLGSLLSVRATIGEYLPHWHRYEDYREMYAARAALGGGVVLSQIHELDYLYSLFGLPATVFALGGHWSTLEIDVEDTASALLACSFSGRGLPVHLHQDFVQWPPTRNCEAIGDKGKAVLDFAALSVTLQPYGDAPPITERWDAFERNDLFVSELSHFLDCVEHRSRPLVDLAEGFASLRIALAIKESLTTGAAVALSTTAHA